MKSLLNLLRYGFCFMLWFFWPQGMWDLNSLTRDQTHTPALEGKVLTTEPAGKSFKWFYLTLTPVLWDRIKMKLRPRGLMTCLSCHRKFLTKLRLKFSIFKIQCFPLGQWLKLEAKDRQLSARNVSSPSLSPLRSAITWARFWLPGWHSGKEPTC